MSRIPDHIIDEIMSTARIEEVIGEYVQLKKSGSNYKALSPFSEENTPSFMVSPAKQIFKDFSSGKGGTVVSFLMEIEHFSYPEALRWLANRYNITVPEVAVLTPEEQEAVTERESLQIINTFARDYFVDAIKNTTEGKTIGYSYFIERGFTSQTIDKFELGYSPKEEKSLTETALEKGYQQKYLETLGLTRTHGERRFDFFSGRVIFPIHSVSGKVLGFGGRILESNKKIAKYFNSPESLLYDKSKILYGLFFAKQEIIKQDRCFLVEGYTDVIALSQAGVENVVSSSGTSLTKGQIRLVQRFTQNITVLYDSDPAGIKASFRGIDLLLEENMNVKVLLFPEGEDPDSFAKSVSTEELKNYIKENQKDFVEFKTEILLKDAENDPIKRAELIKEIVVSIALIPDDISRSVYIQQIANQFEMEEQPLLNELNKIRRRNREKSTGTNLIKELDELDSLIPSLKINEKEHDFYEQEFDLTRILVLYGDRAIEFEGEGNINFEISAAELIVLELERDQLYFQNKLFQQIYTLYKKSLSNGRFYDSSLFLRHDNPEIVKFTTDVLYPKYELSQTWLEKYNIETPGEVHKITQAVKEALYSFKNAIITKRIRRIQEELKNNPDMSIERVTELLTEQVVLDEVRASFATQLGRIII